MKKLTQIQGPKLAINWDHLNEKQYKKLENEIARFLYNSTETPTEYRNRAKNPVDLYGLPFTSCSGYSALWITNSPVTYNNYTVDGVALEEKTLDKILICTDENENTLYFKELKQ